ncbi:reverse transcriptase family protein [Variovorax paradoxus]|uniref:reverse transcriptase family protein n=1 Tax=Variovorax paradoxus TaxID=34073 RepID=UPI00399A22B3
MTQPQRFDPIKVSAESIATIDSLCGALGISAAELAQARALSPSERYIQKELPKKDGSIRIVHNPHYLVRRIQRRINRRIFSNPSVISWPDHIFGSIPNDDTYESLVYEKDYVNCARQHCGAKSILSIDIKDFFDNIHRDQVSRIFKSFLHYSDVVAEALTDICCKDASIVQGALTSSYLATLCLFREEGALVKRLGYKELVYTRLVDDITISSKISNYDFSYALGQAVQMLGEADLPLNAKKTRIQYASMKPLMVHGLRVDFQQPRLPPEEAKRIRAAVKNLELLAASPGYRASRAYRKDFNRCMGRVNKLRRVEHNQHPVLIARLRKILPLPSHADIVRAEQIIQRLKKDMSRPDYQGSFWFHKRCHVAAERLGILGRSFPKKAKELRAQLKLIRPSTGYE